MTIDYIIYPNGLVKDSAGKMCQFRGVDEARAFVHRAIGLAKPAEGDGVLKILALNALGIVALAAVFAVAAWTAEKGIGREDAWHARLEEHAKACDGNCAGEFSGWCPSTRLRLGLVK